MLRATTIRGGKIEHVVIGYPAKDAKPEPAPAPTPEKTDAKPSKKKARAA